MLFKYLWLAAIVINAIEGYGQVTVPSTIDSNEIIIRDIERTTGLQFIYAQEALKKTRLRNLPSKNVSIKDLLDYVTGNSGLKYTLIDSSVILAWQKQVSGLVLNEHGEPLERVSLQPVYSKTHTVTGKDGRFALIGIADPDVVIISSVGYHSREVIVCDGQVLNITLRARISQLDEVKIIGYGTTTQRYSTGNVSKVKGADIQRLPVSNPLIALEGRAPGLELGIQTGVPGAAVRPHIRGQSSIAQSSSPLVLVDGVPLPYGIISTGTMSSAAGNPNLTGDATGGMGIFNTIPMSIIESIEILKDADATAIYGSKGANGVILFTTRNGKAGKAKLNMYVQTGAGSLTSGIKLMHTRQYVEMRRDALQNDGLIPSADSLDPGYAPDITVLDTTRYTDWKRFLAGKVPTVYNAQLCASGGTRNMRYFANADYYREGAVFPGDFYNDRKALFAKVTASSDNRKLTSGFSILISDNASTLPSADPTPGILFLPNGPGPYDSAGRLLWKEKGISFSNPLSLLLETYKTNTTHILWNAQPCYQLWKRWRLKANLGSDYILTRESSLRPTASQNPDLPATSSLYSGYSYLKSWIAEQQLQYTRDFNDLQLDLLAGSSLQTQHFESLLSEKGYANDPFPQSQGASRSPATNTSSDYTYQGFFGRIGLQLKKKYILNLNGRRDGSSRFGPNYRFGNFGSMAMAWVFTNEACVKKAFPFLSFGKLRLSYGTTGNDKIGENMYLDNWSSIQVSHPYAGISGLQPIRPANPDFRWEVSRKFETGLELGFIGDRILFFATWYRNRSSNQLIEYPLAAQTGFSSINPKNFDALVQNSGFELTLTGKALQQNNFSWCTTLLATIPKNKLISFPRLSSSAYDYLAVGHPLTLQRGYHFLGVDPLKGLFVMDDLNKDGLITSPEDKVIAGSKDPRLYGSILNTVIWKSFELNLLVTASFQSGTNPLFYSYNGTLPGQLNETYYSNQPAALFNYWRVPGSMASFQQPGVLQGTALARAAENYSSSDAQLTNASYIRLKSLSACYKFTFRYERSKKLDAKICLQAYNLLTFTHYKSADPDIQNPYVQPLVKMVTAGMEINF